MPINISGERFLNTKQFLRLCCVSWQFVSRRREDREKVVQSVKAARNSINGIKMGEIKTETCHELSQNLTKSRSVSLVSYCSWLLYDINFYCVHAVINIYYFLSSLFQRESQKTFLLFRYCLRNTQQ